jgi:hypothetical protein
VLRAGGESTEIAQNGLGEMSLALPAVDGTRSSLVPRKRCIEWRLPLTSRRLDNDRQPVCANGVAISRSAAPNTGQLKAVGST